MPSNRILVISGISVRAVVAHSLGDRRFFGAQRSFSGTLSLSRVPVVSFSGLDVCEIVRFIVPQLVSLFS